MADAIAGAKDIIAEHISDEADYRIHIRDLTAKKELSVLRQKIRRHSLYMRCIMSLKSR